MVNDVKVQQLSPVGRETRFEDGKLPIPRHTQTEVQTNAESR